MLLPTRHFRASTSLEYSGCEYSCFAPASKSTVGNTEDVQRLMAQNANSRSPLNWLRTLSHWASASGRALGEQVSQAFGWSARKRVLHGGPQVAGSSRPRKKPRLFLLYTEDTGETGLRNIKTSLDRRFPGYTLEPKALGRYKGTSEDSVIAHILTHDRSAVRKAAAEICELNKQESVLCIELLVASAKFVTNSQFKKERRAKAALRIESERRLHSRSRQ
jgi:hypothetical protein